LDHSGLAVPLALLALIIVGVLVTGMFLMLSREPAAGLRSAGPALSGRSAAESVIVPAER